MAHPSDMDTPATRSGGWAGDQTAAILRAAAAVPQAAAMLTIPKAAAILRTAAVVPRTAAMLAIPKATAILSLVRGSYTPARKRRI